MPSRKDTFPGSGMRKQATITKGHHLKKNLLILKFFASLPDLLAIGCYAMPAGRHWQQGKDLGLYCRVLKVVPRKAFTSSNHSLGDPKISAYPKPKSPQLLHKHIPFYTGMISQIGYF